MAVDFDWGLGVGRMCPFDILASVVVVVVEIIGPAHLVYLIFVWIHCSNCSDAAL